MPVHIATTWAMSSPVTTGLSALCWVCQPDSIFSSLARSFASWSRYSAASSYCWAEIAASFSFWTDSRLRSISL